MSFTLASEETEDGTIYLVDHEIEADWSDQTGWFDPDKIDTIVTIVGCGGIGSNVAFELITMGFKRFELYDDDIVEPRNLASQKAYRPSDLYRPKAEALAEVLIQYGATEVITHKRRLTAEDAFNGALVIGAVDSMTSRQLIWEAVSASPDVELYLDGRLHRQIAQVLAVEPLDPEWYTDGWLFSNEEAAQDGECTMRMIVFPATALASTMCRNLGLWYQGEAIEQFIQIDMVNMDILIIGGIE